MPDEKAKQSDQPEGTEAKATETTDKQPNKLVAYINQHEKPIIMLEILLIVLIGAGIFYSYSTQDTVEGPIEDGAISLADSAANVGFADDITEEQREVYDLTVAAAYYREGRFDEALTYYKIAEENGVVSEQMYLNLYQIYKQQNDEINSSDFFNKYVEIVDRNIDSEENNEAKLATIMAMASFLVQENEEILAQFYYQQALPVLEVLESEADTPEYLNETREVIEEALEYK